jgi:hypothetical protein
MPTELLEVIQEDRAYVDSSLCAFRIDVHAMRGCVEDARVTRSASPGYREALSILAR